MKCKKCLSEKPDTEFYANDKTCKECRRNSVKENRELKAEYYREYDRNRSNKPDRVEARKSYAQSEQGRAAGNRAKKAYIERYPMRRAAHIITGNAIRDGRLIRPEQCECCTSTIKIEAHHDDYTKPLDVRWICEACHKEWHRNNQPIYS
ncbi:putative HNH endonuclease [Pararheinheimera phage vB_PsoM_KLER1-1]|nr:putative HNH endonuclease [Pararheinheimera phage vB_PsoM_KLER1-1]